MMSWVKKKKVKHEDAVKIRKLFEESFADLYKWCAITLHFVMDCIQINFVRQIQCMLEGMLPSMKNEEEEELLREKIREKSEKKFEDDSDDEDKKEKEKVVEEVVDPNATDHEQIYIFCIMWSLGAFLENDERKKLEIYMRKHTKLKMPRLPDGDTIFNYNVNVHNGKWWHWNNLISDYVPPEITPQVKQVAVVLR